MAAEVGERTWLSGMEALMWRLGSDPVLLSTFGSVSILERPPDPTRVRRRLADAVAAVPRLRQRVRPPAVPGTPPWWEDDPDFDVERHLAWADLSPGGDDPADRRQLLDTAARRIAEPFPPDRPPWDLEVLTGLRHGRAALVLRMHHAVSDGEGVVALSERFVDLSPDEPEPAPDPFVGEDASPTGGTWGERTILAATDRIGDLVRSGTTAARRAGDALADPAQWGELGRTTVETLRSLQRQLLVLDDARSPLWTDRSTQRRLVVGSVPLAPVRDAATRTGTSVNEVFVTAVLRGASTYHRHHGHPVGELRVAVPVSTRREGTAAGNAFSVTRALLPTGEALAVGPHLGQVSRRLTEVRNEPSTALTARLAELADVVPGALLAALFRRQTATIDVVTSNLRSSPLALYVAGARVEATYAVGPLLATPANVTMMSYDDRIDIGLHVDVAAVNEPELLRDAIVGALHEVVDTVTSR